MKAAHLLLLTKWMDWKVKVLYEGDSLCDEWDICTLLRCATNNSVLIGHRTE